MEADLKTWKDHPPKSAWLQGYEAAIKNTRVLMFLIEED